jgi:pyridoxal phosphate enzyme (YggS family)
MNFESIIADCRDHLKKFGRAPESLNILAVSKLQPVEKIKILYEKGQRHFAENYVQEALQKQESLKDFEIQWHFIGTLQKNKANLVVGKFALIHSVDSLELARIISQQAQKSNFRQKILLQVNLAQEFTKGGFSRDTLKAHWPEIVLLPGLEITGLMTMPPLTENPEDVRPFFRDLSGLRLELMPQTSSQHPLRELSMGTSHDYHVAIEEGATIVRLGTILFGERPKKN